MFAFEQTKGFMVAGIKQMPCVCVRGLEQTKVSWWQEYGRCIVCALSKQRLNGGRNGVDALFVCAFEQTKASW